MIPYSRQEITEDDILEVEKVLRSDLLTQGPVVPKFEKAVSNYCGASYSIAMNSATSALHIACLALDLGPGDWLWTSPNTFVASANCGLYCGAKVDFVDIDENTFNMSIDSLSNKLKLAEKFGKLPKVLVPVHYAGQPCDMQSIYDLSLRYGFKIVEDASHAIGSSFDKTKVGSCVHSDITVFSFHPVKIITTGEGGMALTNNVELADKIRCLSTHGITKDKSKMQLRSKNEIWNYQQIKLGFNYRMNDIQAALGLSQMNRLDEYVSSRQEIAEIYSSKFDKTEIIIQKQIKNTRSSFHLYPILIKENRTKKNQRQIYKKLINNGIMANLHYIPVHRHPYYESFGFKKGDFPNSEQFHKEAISLPVFPKLKIEECENTVQLILEAINDNGS
tara:strand:+ start:879 stop:2051 length:1173 start_codon:yes stop_codon:yes gene_type:complete